MPNRNNKPAGHEVSIDCHECGRSADLIANPQIADDHAAEPAFSLSWCHPASLTKILPPAIK
jgi:hypothetical protein